ncbi:hypothetical protein [Polaromonas sp.]|jgi:hypothetical protein|uniref:hypothetical protein n=1 Tax=Polaromonas sp. TaxID=1869339 RepID=UPI0037CA8A75
MQLKPQDFVVALKLVAWGDQRWTYARLAQELGLSASEAHACIKRGLQAGLLVQNHEALAPEVAALAVHEPAAIYRVARRKRVSGEDAPADNPVRPHARQLAEFALHGAKYAFAADKTPSTIGVPTSHSAPAFAGVFAPGSEDYVWPHPNGIMRGIGIEPLHPSVPFAAMQDARLYEMLALFDALRVGRARERGMAMERLQALIDPSAPKPLKGPVRG